MFGATLGLAHSVLQTLYDTNQVIGLTSNRAQVCDARLGEMRAAWTWILSQVDMGPH